MMPDRQILLRHETFTSKGIVIGVTTYGFSLT